MADTQSESPYTPEVIEAMNARHGSSTPEEMAARMRDAGYEDWEIADEMSEAQWASRAASAHAPISAERIAARADEAAHSRLPGEGMADLSAGALVAENPEPKMPRMTQAQAKSQGHDGNPMRRITQAELDEAIGLHREYLAWFEQQVEGLETGVHSVQPKRGERLVLMGCDLAGLDLHGADLRFAILDNCKLARADMRNCELDHAEITGSTLEDADLSGAKLHRTDMQETRIQGTALTGADMTEANLSHAQMLGCRLDGADLTGAVLLQAHSARSAVMEAHRSEAGVIGAPADLLVPPLIAHLSQEVEGSTEGMAFVEDADDLSERGFSLAAMEDMADYLHSCNDERLRSCVTIDRAGDPLITAYSDLPEALAAHEVPSPSQAKDRAKDAPQSRAAAIDAPKPEPAPKRTVAGVAKQARAKAQAAKQGSTRQDAPKQHRTRAR